MCEGCKHLWIDRSVNAYDCEKCNEMTEEQFEKYFINDEEGCILYEEIDYEEN